MACLCGAAGWTWISIRGPSILGNALWGPVLNVEEAHLSSSHAFIHPLFSGVQGNGSSEGRGSVASR